MAPGGSPSESEPLPSPPRVDYPKSRGESMSFRTPFAVATALLLLAASPAGPRQDRRPCDVAKVQDGQYCPACKKVLVKTEKATDFDKDGKCKMCGGAPEKVKVCAKDWIPSCNMHGGGPHAAPCCRSKMCCKIDTVYAVVTWTCKACGASAGFEERIAHHEGEHDRNLEKSCANSGTFPHGGEPPAEK